MKFTEEKPEKTIIALLEKEGIPYVPGSTIVRQPDEVFIRYGFDFQLNSTKP
ncbi:MAG: hypothetical protein ACK4VN_16080 [Bacteroidales bacterium]